VKLLSLLTEHSLALGSDFVVVGGHAVNVYGLSRQTGDLDLLVASADGGIWKGIMENLDYSLYHEHPSFLQYKPPSIYEWPVDLILVNDKTFKALRDDAYLSEALGVPCRIASIRHLVAMKLHAMMANPKERELKDMADIEGLIRKSDIDLRSKEFENLCRRFANDEVYRKFLR